MPDSRVEPASLGWGVRTVALALVLAGSVAGCPPDSGGGSGGGGGAAATPGVTYTPQVTGSNGTFLFDIYCTRNEDVATASALLTWAGSPGVPACPEVTYIQVVRSTDNHGHEVGQPGQQGRLTPDGWSVDKLDTHVAGGVWYGVGQNGQYDPDLGQPAAVPGGVPRLDDEIKAGRVHWPITYEYVTCTVCKSGANVGRVLDCVYWSFKVESDGSVSAPTGRLPNPAEKNAFKTAVDKWNQQAAASGGTQPPAPPLTW